MEFKQTDVEFMTKQIERLRNFLKELDIDLSIRLVNTFTFECKRNSSRAKELIVNYVKLTGGDYELAKGRVQSKEFIDLINAFKFFQVDGAKRVNKRLKLYYGPQGGGKTTEALKEADGNCIICNSSMLPSDLLEDFKLSDGKGNLVASPLMKAMKEGKPIVLDEISMLSMQSLRMLQGLLDNKETFNYKGEVINIKDGFQVIGTMNLFVNGTCYSLPAPLVDRAYELKEFDLSPAKLLEYAFE